MPSVLVNDILLAAAYLTMEEGYVKAVFGKESTAVRTSELIAMGDVEELDLATDYQNRVDSAKAWILTQDSSEYIDKIVSLLANPSVEDNNISILSSLFAGYDRSFQFKNERQNDLDCEHAGEEGGVVVFKLEKWKFINECNSTYGKSYLYKLYDDENHLYTWFTTKRVDKELNDLPSVRATVKKHNERDGVKQNQIANVSMSNL